MRTVNTKNWEVVIGLEVHAQLATESKIFSGAATAYGAAPNTQACAIDLGFPGVLPVLNREAVRMAVLFGLAVDAHIAERCIFARKNYFYPDLPKGYQISQYELPIVSSGAVYIEGDEGLKRIQITRAHLEEDAGKSVHDIGNATGIDLNRAGTPLIEIVSEPDLRSAAEAVAYMRKIHEIVTYLEICDGNMQEGSFRCDANVSVRKAGESELGTRTETKNLNSFRFVERAINYEIARQIEVLETGGTVVQETRLFDAERDETRSMRAKEGADDYRYFPDPDLLPVELDRAYIQNLAHTMPELAEAKRKRFVEEYGLSCEDVAQLTANKASATYFEAAVSQSAGEAKLVANWQMGELTARLRREGLEIEHALVSPAQLGGLVQRIADGTISSPLAKEVFDALWQGAEDADEVIKERGLEVVLDVEPLVDEVIAHNPDQVLQYRAGKTKVLGFFVGQIMKASQGKADPARVNALLKTKLGQGQVE